MSLFLSFFLSFLLSFFLSLPLPLPVCENACIWICGQAWASNSVASSTAHRCLCVRVHLGMSPCGHLSAHIGAYRCISLRVLACMRVRVPVDKCECTCAGKNSMFVHVGAKVELA